MDVIITIVKQKKIKILLVFFCFLTVLSCSKGTIELTKIYNESNRVIAIQLNHNLDSETYHVVLKGNTTPVLGAFTTTKEGLNFKPIIPFTAGESYQVKKDNKVITEFTVPALQNEVKPIVEHIYPTTNVVPENLLKMYFVFSKPMQEVGNILDYITIVNSNENLQKDVFLKLESELWNKEHTVLTLWLDPGRIKTDLIPNKEKGLPILNGNSYSLTIKKELKSAKGISMSADYIKNFEVTTRDNKKPSTSLWQVQLPEKNTTNELVIRFNESLDAILLLETVSVYHKNKEIKGEFSISSNETLLHFKPQQNWQGGEYQIIISSVLEDLAGNNLNHLFDNDIDLKSNDSPQTPTKTISFRIE